MNEPNDFHHLSLGENTIHKHDVIRHPKFTCAVYSTFVAERWKVCEQFCRSPDFHVC